MWKTESTGGRFNTFLNGESEADIVIAAAKCIFCL